MSQFPTVPGYKITRQLGSGGYSVVYLGEPITECADAPKYVAIKVIEKTGSQTYEEAQAEWNLQGKFVCPYIIDAYDLIERPKYFILISEYANGGELFDAIINEGPHTEEATAVMVQQILVGLKVMHDNGVVHRDLKPENLLLSVDEQGNTTIKITDFGLAGLFSNEANMNRFCGTEGYAAPEIVRNIPYDASVDIWSLGVIVYILLCGFRPFDSDDPNELKALVCRGEIDFPPEDWDQISGQAKGFIRSMLELEPRRRITIDEALAHPWITGQAPKVKLDSLHQHLREFTMKKKLRRVMGHQVAVARLKRLISEMAE